MSDRKIQLTADGSHTIYSHHHNVPYHSLHGAVQETNHVFINAGLAYKSEVKNGIRIFEMGFGTGLNCLCTFSHCRDRGLEVEYSAVDLHPLTEEEYKQLNYVQLEGLEDLSEVFMHIHSSSWGPNHKIDSNFSLQKIKANITELDLPSSHFDIIYFDAFAPQAQPELWETELMRKLFDTLKDDGVLVTYCAQGQFKRNLKSAGFKVEALPGPIGKREMTRAHKKVN